MRWLVRICTGLMVFLTALSVAGPARAQSRREEGAGELAQGFALQGNDANVDSPVANYSANGIYYFDVRHVTPYATFGLGVEHVGRSIKNPDPLIVYAPASTELS